MSTTTTTVARTAPVTAARAGAARVPMPWALAGTVVAVLLAVLASLLLGRDIERATAVSALATYCFFCRAGIWPRSALPVICSAPAPSSA